jgi:hypothetical protein
MTRLLLTLLFLLTPAWGQLQIKIDVIRATYGAGSTQADVTERVKASISNGGILLRVGADTLGLDPAPNIVKTLTVEYRQGILRRVARVNDGEMLRLGTVPAESLRITKAMYGDGRRMRDVAALLTSRVTANRLELAVTNENLGGDPAPAVKKSIVVDYEYNGQPASVTIAEGQTLLLPPAAASPAVSSGTLRVTRAIYGAGLRGRADVTGAVAGLVTANALEFTVDGNVLGGDPAPGTVKTLTVEYEWNGQRQTATAKDGEVMRVNKATPVSTLRILRASYSGGRRATADVTRIVSERVAGDFLELTVNGETLGGDPAPGIVKTLTVEYEWNGQRQTATARDMETLVIPAVTSLNVVRAVYGVPGRMIDATSAVSARRSANRLELTVNGETLGGDPAPGVVKTLTVDYDVNGRRRTASARDGETLRLPGAASATPAPDAPGMIPIPPKGKAPLQ